jgi:putative CRISPR-associated protein (TIGR02619 family)
MAKLVVSTCGTSLLTDAAGDTVSLLRDTSSVPLNVLSAEQRTALDRHIAERITRLAESDLPAARHLCAELHGLIANGDLDDRRRGDDHHILIHGDTYQSTRTAAALADWIGRYRSVEMLTVAGLVPTRVADFRAALGELARLCLDAIEWHRGGGRQVIFNLNGGFKSVQGFMQTLGCHAADECVYIFETSREVMRIPRLPMTLDPEGIVGNHLATMRRLGAGDPLPLSEIRGIPETLLLEVDGEAVLSAWGEIVWRSCRSRYYGQELLPPPTASITYAARFKRQAAALPSDRLVQLNRQVDALAVFLSGPRLRSPASLSFKPLKAGVIDRATHEFYAWSDGNASRCFGSFGDPQHFVIDRLGDHL